VGGILITLALVAALVTVGVKVMRRGPDKRRRAQFLSEQAGYSPDKPVRIASFTEIDDAIGTWRCPCGGLLDRIGEGARPGMRVVRCMCVVCEEDVDLFFDLSELRH